MGYGDMNENYHLRSRSMGRKEQLTQQVEVILDRLASIADRPEEPVSDDPDGACVIWFEKKFNNTGRTYTYAGVKAGGAWYLTGPSQHGHHYNWDRLCDFIFEEYESNRTEYRPVIWYASEWSEA